MKNVYKVWGYRSEYTQKSPLYVCAEDSYKALTKARKIDPRMVAVQLFDKGENRFNAAHA